MEVLNMSHDQSKSSVPLNDTLDKQVENKVQNESQPKSPLKGSEVTRSFQTSALSADRPDHKLSREVKADSHDYTDPKIWSIEGECYVLWALVVILGIIMVLFHHKEVAKECPSKWFLLFLSYAITVGTIVEALFVYICWSLTSARSKIRPKKMSYIVVAAHCLTGGINMVIATFALRERVCFETSSGLRERHRQETSLGQFILRYDIKIVGLMHILLAIFLFASAMYVGKKRTDNKINELKRRGLLREYYWFTYD